MRRESAYKLSPEDVKIMELRDKYHMTYNDIASNMGISRSRIAIRYKRAKNAIEELGRIKEYKDLNPNTVDGIAFSKYVFAHVNTITYNALVRAGKLYSKEKFMSMTDDEIIRIRNIGTKGFLEIKKLMKIIDGSINENEYSFKDEDIDPEILPIVKNFNDAGIKTISSCQGHFNKSNDGGGIYIPYLMINYPKNDILTSLIFKRLNKYPMLRIATGRNPNFELFDNIDHSKVSDYSKLLDKVINETDNATIYISTNPIMYNIPEEIDPNSRKEIFEYLRKRFLTELSHLSEELLKESIDIKTNCLYRAVY